MHGALAHNLKLNVNWIEAEGLETRQDDSCESQLEGVRRHSGSGRLRQARHRRHVEGDPLCARKQGTLLRHLPRHADRLHRVRARRLRTGAGELERVRSGNAASRDLQAARAARRRRTGRHDAARRVDLQDRAGHAGAQDLREDGDQRTASPSLRVQSRIRRANGSGGLRISGSTPDGTYVEMVEFPDHPFISSAASSIPSSSRSRSSRIRCSARSWARPTRTG